MMWWVVVLIAACLTLVVIVWLAMADAKKTVQPKTPGNAAGSGKKTDTSPTNTGVGSKSNAKSLTAVASKSSSTVTQAFDRQAEEDVEHIFNDSFREELRNRGRLHFEKIIGENAMFLQQDLRLTTSQLNDYMKEEITTKLKEEFTKYEQSIVDAKEVAIEAIEKTKQAVEDNRAILLKQLEQEFAEEKNREIKRFDENMTDIINHYLVAAIGDQIDLSDQLEYIIANLESNKKAIIQDLINGA